MSSFFTLELDTTSPQVEVYLPQYTTPSTLTEIVVKANESLLDNAEIYVVDSQGDKYDYTFYHNDDEFFGQTYFNDVSLGIATLYVRVYDEVLNKSDLISHSFNIIKSEILKINIYNSIQNIDTDVNLHKLTTNNKLLSTITYVGRLKVISKWKLSKTKSTTKISEVQ